MDLSFEWDPRKAAENCVGSTACRSRRRWRSSAIRWPSIFDDPDHSATEPRELIVGHCNRRRLLLISFVQRGDRVRVVSARKATRQERKDYEEGTTS